jgi:hypothetical protein
MKYLYKYPQREYPYRDLIETNRGRSREEFEYELLDTSVFNEDRYFDVFVEYAKEGPEDVLIRITVHNRGPEAARLRLLPTLWFRNAWSWGEDDRKPSLREAAPGVIQASHHELGEYRLYCDGGPELLFTENESNAGRLWGQPNASPYVKDAFHAYIISGQGEAANPAKVGTKAAAHYVLEVPADGSQTVRLRLAAAAAKDAFRGFEGTFKNRIGDTDEFYQRITPHSLSEDESRVHRQALAGMLWSKQFYYFDLEKWLREHKSHPLVESARNNVRNTEWFHMLNADVISMPDKWEYPWYAMDRIGSHHDEMGDEEDGFFYDLLRLPDGQAMRLKVRSLVGLLPLCASTVFEADSVTRHPKFMEMITLFRKRHPELAPHVAPTDESYIGYRGRRLLSILNRKKLEQVLGYLLDENEFLGPHGIRSLSRYHLDHPFIFWVGHEEYKVQYLPAESNTGVFGGNSNWRGPVWMPVNVLIVRALVNLYAFYGDDFKVQCPTGSDRYMTLFEVAQDIVRRLAGTFLRDANGRRPVYGGTARFQEDPHWRDLILFFEYFHGDNGAGLGASHQTGWTGLVAPLLGLFGRVDAKALLESERGSVIARVIKEQVGGETIER